MLREIPVVAFRIGGGVAAIAVELVRGFIEDHRTCLLGAKAVLVHIIHHKDNARTAYCKKLTCKRTHT